MHPRIVINLILLLVILYAPWWLVAILLALTFIFIERFYEGIVWSAVTDSLYGVSYGSETNLYMTFLFASTLLFLLIMFLRTRLKFYSLP